MLKWLKRLDSQQGQVLPTVLILMVLGSLTVVPVLNHATTSLRTGQVIDAGIKGTLAADAGIQYVLWCLDNSVPPPASLSEPVNGMNVALEVVDHGEYTLYFGELIEAGKHSNYLGVSGAIEWDDAAEAWEYTITVTWQPENGHPTIHLEGVGARLPVGYTYQTGSAAVFGDNLTASEPEQVQDVQGAWMVNWEFDNPLPSVSESNPTATQSFYISGNGEQDGHYAWVVANRDDIGETGEISGTLYTVTATASDPSSGETAARIVASVMQEGGSSSIASWQVFRR